MLLALDLKDFALVEKAEINFLEDGLTVLTGETGAGKSIIIDALGLCLGERASTDFIRSGYESAIVSALFDVSKLELVKNLLEEYGISSDSNLLITREIQRNGRNICRVNGHISTVSIIRTIAPHLVDIHSQHENTLLLDQDYQRQMIDSFDKDSLRPMLIKIENLLAQRKQYLAEMQQLGGKKEEIVRELDLLQYQANEIEAANLSENEENELLQERNRLRNFEKLQEIIVRARTLFESSDGYSLLQLLGDIVMEIEDIVKVDTSISGLKKLFSSAYYQLEEAERELLNYEEGLEFDADSLDKIEARLYHINQLKRKYGTTVADVLDYWSKLTEKITFLENSEENRKILRKKIENLEAEYKILARELSQQRQITGDIIAHELEPHLRELGMPHAKVECQVEFDSQVLSINGSDNIVFMFSANKGEPLKPLHRIASGGELARVMLSLKAVTIGKDEGPPTMILDEVDVGIGGLVAKSIANKLKIIAKCRQVLCITHLPTIAAVGNMHLSVRKKTVGNRTITQLKNLECEERVDELARMLGGARDDQITRQHAIELLRFT